MFPWDWIIAAGGTISGISQAVYNWVTNLITSVVSWINSAISNIWDYIYGFYGMFRYFWGQVIDWIDSVYNTVWGWVANLGRDIYNWGAQQLNSLWHYVYGVYAYFVDQINQIYKYLYGWIRDIYTWVQKNIWDPLYRMYLDVRQWVMNLFNVLWQYIEHPELLVQLIAKYLLSSALQLIKRFAVPVTRWIIKAMRSMAGEVFDMLESVISSII